MDLRRAILDTSLDLIATDGVGALSLREVARRLKVTHGAPYYHFKDRADIFAALTKEGMELLAAALRAGVEREAGDARAALEACGCAYVAFALERPAYFKIMYRPELAGTKNRAAIRKASAKAFQVLADAVEQCQKKGMSHGLDGHALALTGWSTAHGLAALCVDGHLASGAAAEELGRTVARTFGALVAGR